MRLRTTAYFLASMLLMVSSSIAQDASQEKPIRTGIWQGNQIEYLEGRIAIKLANPSTKNLAINVLETRARAWHPGCCA